jgi:hypothetical protein
VFTAGTGSFPRKAQDRHMPVDRHIAQVRWSIPVSKLCYCNEQVTEEGGIAILVHRYINHNAVPVQGLEYLEATAI